MPYELVFSAVGLIAMIGWIALLLSPLIPVWSDRIAGIAIPAMLSLAYVIVLVFFPAQGGGFGNFAEVMQLFSHPQAVMAGWVHFLAFDLLIGAWICRKARDEGMSFWFVLPCLPLTFLFGPAGFLMFSVIRAARYPTRRAEIPG